MLAVTMDSSLKIYLSTLMKTKCWMLTEAGMRMLKGAEDAEEDRSDKNADKEEAPVTEDPGGSVGGGSAPPTPQVGEQKGSLKTNEVTLSADEFESHVDDFAAFSFLTDNGISRSGAEAFVKQRMHSSLKRRSPFLLNQFINQSVQCESFARKIGFTPTGRWLRPADTSALRRG